MSFQGRRMAAARHELWGGSHWEGNGVFRKRRIWGRNTVGLCLLVFPIRHSASGQAGLICRRLGLLETLGLLMVRQFLYLWPCLKHAAHLREKEQLRLEWLKPRQRTHPLIC
jgi:hypothetical protein